MPSANDQYLDALRAKQAPTFKQLKWRLIFSALGLILVALILLGVLGLFELQRTSAADVETREWRQLQQIVEQLQSEEGARSLYGLMGPRIQSAPTEAEFLRQVERNRPRLEPLPAHVPRALWGRASCTVQDHGKARQVWISYRTTQGLRISGHWDNGTLLALSLD